MLARCVHPSPHPSLPSLHLDLEYVPYASQTSERRSSIKVAGGIPDDACCRVASVRLARSGKGVQRCHVTVRADLINLSTSVRAVLGCTVKIAHRIFDDATGRVVVLECVTHHYVPGAVRFVHQAKFRILVIGHAIYVAGRIAIQFARWYTRDSGPCGLIPGRVDFINRACAVLIARGSIKIA
jgi:hypothetical protein